MQQVSVGILHACDPDVPRAGSVAPSQGRARRRASRCAVTAVVAESPELQAGDLLAAISSLYDDELRPYGRLIRKRLAELRSVAEKPCWELSDLRTACDVTPGVELDREEPGEWSARLVGRSDTFVDMYCREDTYPKYVWTSLAVHVASLGDAAALPGGRYSCARSLVDAKLGFLAGLSLGEVCHIVQLALIEKRLLGYLDGTISSYERSHSMVKDSAAKSRVGSGTVLEFPIAKWAMVRKCLAEVLAELPGMAMKQRRRHLPLSTLKRLFRSRYQLELSETALGYTKLSALLQDPQINDVCSVMLTEQGYVVLPPAAGFKYFQMCEAESTCAGSLSNCASDVSPLRRAPLCLEEPLCSDGIVQTRPSLTPNCNVSSTASFAEVGCINSIVQNTFIHAAIPPLTSFSSATSRSQSLPKDMGSSRSLWEVTSHEFRFPRRRVVALSDAAVDQCVPVSFGSVPKMHNLVPATDIGLPGPAFDDRTLFSCEPICLPDASVYDWTDFPSPTPWTPTDERPQSLSDSTAARGAWHFKSSPSRPASCEEQSNVDTIPGAMTPCCHVSRRVLCLDDIIF